MPLQLPSLSVAAIDCLLAPADAALALQGVVRRLQVVAREGVVVALHFSEPALRPDGITQCQDRQSCSALLRTDSKGFRHE